VNAVLKAFLLLVGLAALLIAAAFMWISSRGISARTEPGRVEAALTRTMRRLAIPSGQRNRPNPVKATPEVLAAGMAHYADHCAACHANDGSGHTPIGSGMYPKAPDMRQSATQDLTDGELFYIIENGVRLTGMPAWGTGTAADAEETWHLVHFIRHLVRLSDAELEQMKTLNPTPPAEIRQQLEEERFLNGGGDPPPPSAPHHH
jgi:mono/diheme cytochrome c family protein